MKHLLRYYPITLTVAIAIIYLSCFKPPQNSLEEIPNFDKVVHGGMYFCLAILAWYEFFRYQKTKKSPAWWRGWFVGLLFPVLLGAAMEVAQRYLTTYRSFEWCDILADTVGAVIAGIFVAVYLRQHTEKRSAHREE
jgi:VanZ family protein